MTDAERLAKVMRAAWEPVEADHNTVAQRLIDSGVVTVNPPPDPAEQIADAWEDQLAQDVLDAACNKVADIRMVVRALRDSLREARSESVADHMRRAGWTDRQIGAAMDAKGSLAVTAQTKRDAEWAER